MSYLKKHKIFIFNRSPTKIQNTSCSYALSDLKNFIPHFDLLINATSVGHIENINATPVDTKLLEKAKKTMIVYDIIYDPIKTILLRNSQQLGLSTINGLRMNLIQAVLAYGYTNKTALSKEEIYKIMN